VTRVLVVGAGAVGGRTVRQLVETAGVDEVLVCDRVPARAEGVCRAIGEQSKPIAWDPSDGLPPGLGAVAVALPPPFDRLVAERAVDARVPCASVADDAATVQRLLDLDDAAAEARTVIAVGCGLAPGLADVLARHAADTLDVVEEVHVARFGAAGPACAAVAHGASRGRASEWRDGRWAATRAGGGRQLVWFPEPVGAVDCFRSASGQPALLLDAFPTLQRASCRIAARRRERIAAQLPWRRLPAGEGGYGAVWVEVRGRRGQAREVLVYGVVDRMAIAAGSVLAVATMAVAGIGAGGVRVELHGAHGLGALTEPVPFLAELARRGVRVAAFDGSSPPARPARSEPLAARR